MRIPDKFMRLFILSFVFGLFASGAIAYGQPTFSLTITTPHDVVQAGSEVLVTITLKNISDHDIYGAFAVTHSAVGESFHGIEIKSEKGVRAPLTRYGHLAKGETPPADKTAQSQNQKAPQAGGSDESPFTGSVVSVTIPPGGISRDAIVANKLYDLSQPGKYSIQVNKWDVKSKTMVTSNIITVTVIPAAP
jgi:hypothetical protein